MASNPLPRVLRANLQGALRHKDLAEAETLLARLKDEDPLSVQTRGLELEYLIAKGRWADAEQQSAQLLKLYPASARIHYLAARVYYRNKDYGRAVDHFGESERIHTHWVSRRWLGKAHTQQGEFQQAEALLVPLVPTHPGVGLDLAWLYERWGQPERALQYLDTYLALKPEDDFARAQRLRLRASAVAPEELLEEVATLLELDETLPTEMLASYVQRLLETGRGAEARRFVTAQEANWDERTAASIAWLCHRLQAYDLALRLFLQGLKAHLKDFKYLSALESAAVHCARVDEVIQAYEPLTCEEQRLYGRIKSLQKKTR